MKKASSVCIGVLFGSEHSFAWTVDSALKTGFCAPPGTRVVFAPVVTGALTPAACTKIVETALEYKTEFVMILHSDIAWMPEHPWRLMSHDLDIVAGWSCGRTYPHIVHAARTYNPETQKWALNAKPGHGVEEVAAFGGGMWCIKTKVFAALPLPWFNWEHTKDGRTNTEDLAFCRLAKEHGFKCHIDWAVCNFHKADMYGTGPDGSVLLYQTYLHKMREGGHGK